MPIVVELRTRWARSDFFSMNCPQYAVITKRNKHSMSSTDLTLVKNLCFAECYDRAVLSGKARNLWVCSSYAILGKQRICVNHDNSKLEARNFRLCDCRTVKEVESLDPDGDLIINRAMKLQLVLEATLAGLCSRLSGRG